MSEPGDDEFVPALVALEGQASRILIARELGAGTAQTAPRISGRHPEGNRRSISRGDDGSAGLSCARKEASISDPTVKDLVEALRAIRSAAKGVRDVGWSNATHLDQATRDFIDVVQHPFDLEPRLNGYRETIANDCELWLKTYATAGSQDRQLVAFNLIMRMIGRMDMLIVILPSRG